MHDVAERPLEGLSEDLRALRPFPRVLLEALENEVLERRRHEAVELPQPDRLAVHDLVGDRREAVSPERTLAGERLVQDRAEGPDVDQVLLDDGNLVELLRRHVRRRPGRRLARGEGGVFAMLRDPEVEDQRLAVLAHEDVLGLQVAMNRAVSVGVGDSPADLRHQADDAGDALRFGQRRDFFEPLVELAAAHVLHHEIGMAVVLARVEDLHDVRVAQHSEVADLAPEALDQLGAAGSRIVHDLERDQAVAHRGVRAEVDRPHSSAAELLDDAVRPDAGRVGDGALRADVSGRIFHEKSTIPTAAPRWTLHEPAVVKAAWVFARLSSWGSH